MKRILLTAAVCFSIAANAQSNIPNSGFEEGDGLIVKDWATLNNAKRTTGFTTMVDGQAVTVQPREGSYFLQLATAVNGSDIRIGSASITIGNVGYPDSLTYNVVYFKKIADDNFIINIDFLKYDASLHQSTVVMQQGASGFTAGTTWKRNSSQFWYFGDKPDYDSLRITIMSSNPSQHDPDTGNPRFADGTTVLIDAIGLVSNTTGINDYNRKSEKISVYPNPSTGDFTLALANSVISPSLLQVFDMQGHCVLSESVAAGIKNVPVQSAAWKPGTYFYRLSGNGVADFGKLLRLP